MEINYWIDRKGRKVEVHTMSNGWLRNILRKLGDTEKTKPIREELRRRKNKRKKTI